MKWLYNPPQIIKNIFRQFVWESKSNNVLLTFDDGPVPGNTEVILKHLQRNSVKAVFFCVGNNINKYSSLAKEIIDEGHSIGNHTFNHRKLNELSLLEMVSEINSCNRVISEKLSYDVKYFRPPHGRIKLSLAKELEKLKLKNIMWSLLTYDYKSNISIVRKSAQKYLANSSIVLMHDNVKSQNIIVDAIDIILEEAAKKNFTIGTPEECLK